MPKIDLIQNTPEWLEWRRSKITATDASIIMETNVWTTPLELWEEKLMIRKPKPLNDAMKRGQELEHEARELFIQETGIKVEACVYQSDKYDWMGASLDGLSTCGEFLLEIKCPGNITHQEAMNGHLKEYYRTQMDHQIAVVNPKICVYATYRPEHEVKFFYTEYVPCDGYKDTLIEKEKDFWICMCTMSPPKRPFELKLRK